MPGFILPLGDTQGVEVGDLVQVARDALADGHLSFGEVVQLGGLLASKVRQFVGLSGHQKQKVVLGVLEKACADLLEEKLEKLPEDQREAYRAKLVAAQEFAKDVLPSVLDLAVSAAKGKLDLRSVKKSCWTVLCAGVKSAAKHPVVLVPIVATVAPGAAKAIEAAVAAPAPAPEVAEEKSGPAPEESVPAEETRPANTVVESNPQEAP
jgi:hypothetical protein